jgi:hypothetical protein
VNLLAVSGVPTRTKSDNGRQTTNACATKPVTENDNGLPIMVRVQNLLALKIVQELNSPGS